MNKAVERMLARYQTKTRSGAERALREILQEIALVGLWRGKFFQHAAFYGGTALRILYGLDRFSEDLDFTLLDMGRSFDWKHFENQVTQELSSYGFEVSFTQKTKKIKTAVQSAFLKTNTMGALLQIGLSEPFKKEIHPESLIRIKVEIDSDPVIGFEVAPHYISEPMPIPIQALKESSLFAGKAHAAIFRAWKGRIKGRVWYDLIWFLRRGIPLNAHYFSACMRSSGELREDQKLTEADVKDLLVKRIHEIDLEDAKSDVSPFLRDPTQLDLWNIAFFSHWIDRLHFEK